MVILLIALVRPVLGVPPIVIRSDVHGRCAAFDLLGFVRATPLALRLPRANEAHWRLRVDPAQRIVLFDPSGRAVADKPLGSDVDCQELGRVAVVLLSAHSPALRLTRRSSPPAVQPWSRWRVQLAGGLAAPFGEPSGFGTIAGYYRPAQRLALGFAIHLSHRSEELSQGNASFTTLAGRGLLATGQSFGPLRVLAGASLGIGALLASTDQLPTRRSIAVSVFSAGGFAQALFALGDNFRAGLGLAVLALLPRRRFEVSGLGVVYRSALPQVEFSLVLGWESDAR
ncbi:MAG: hypothetical protein H6707_13560 [Deltaproteobacteria bacterium]|nr:hypothetical protein [Deltaproteobacteria bacterium]